jgi:hypothetical protein
MSLPKTNWAGLSVYTVEHLRWIPYFLAAKKGPTDLFCVFKYLFPGAVINDSRACVYHWTLHVLLGSVVTLDFFEGSTTVYILRAHS